MAIKPVPMKGRLTGKRISGYIWAGSGKKWLIKENYFQLEDKELISATIGTAAGSFWIRCNGMTCEVTLHGQRGNVLGKATLALPGARKVKTQRAADVQP
jgi:hypothetical protein